MGGDKRAFKPEELERLAGMMGSLGTSADEAFKRASSLNVSSQMSPLRELPGWAGKEEPDYRRRAALLRLEDGDPLAGLTWAGFNGLELSANGDKIDPTTLIYVNTVAAWAAENGRADLGRKPNESLDDYLERIGSEAVTRTIPALKPHQKTVDFVMKAFSEYRGLATTMPVVTTQGAAILRWMANQKLWFPLVQKLTGRPLLQERALTAPGTYLSSLTRKLFAKSALYRDYISMLPEYTEMDSVGHAVNGGRALLGARVNNFLNLTFGNNELAMKLQSFTHNGVPLKVSGQTNLFKVWAATGDAAKMEQAATVLGVDAAKLSRFGALAKTAGGLRMLGIAGGVAGTIYSGANVIAQGNPVDAFKRNGAGYVADVAEFGFNASLTAAMIAPNPFTVGAAVIFGGIYLGAKVVEHWDDIKKGASKAVDATKNFFKSLF